MRRQSLFPLSSPSSSDVMPVVGVRPPLLLVVLMLLLSTTGTSSSLFAAASSTGGGSASTFESAGADGSSSSAAVKGGSLGSSGSGVVNYTHVGLSCGVEAVMASFDFEHFESSVASSLNCSLAQIGVVTFSPTLVDALILVDFVLVTLLEDPTHKPSDILSAKFMSEYETLKPLSSEYQIVSVLLEPSLSAPPRLLQRNTTDGAGDVTLPRRVGATGFIGMLVVMCVMLLTTIVFIIFYLVRGRHDKSLVATAATFGAPPTNLSAWVLGSGENIAEIYAQGKLEGVGPHLSSIAAGAHHMLLVAHGELYVAGANARGQLGLGSRAPRTSFVRNDFFKDYAIAKVLCGEEHSAVITADGKLFTFGSGAEGALGHGEWKDTATPTPVAAFEGKQVIGAACGTHHTVVLCDDGLYSFGWNGHGQLMLGHSQSMCEPCRVTYFNEYEGLIREIACGVTSTLVLCSDWEVYGCGGNEQGQLGLGHWDDVWEPELIPLAETSSYVHSISCWYHTLISCDDGCYACGEADGFKTGLMDEDASHTLQWVEALGEYDIRFAFAGNEHSIFVSASYEVFVVGRSSGGKLGAGEWPYTEPTLINLGEVLGLQGTVEYDPTSGYPILTFLALGPTYTVLLMSESSDDSTSSGGGDGGGAVVVGDGESFDGLSANEPLGTPDTRAYRRSPREGHTHYGHKKSVPPTKQKGNKNGGGW